jgi:hypothetical protein
MQTWLVILLTILAVLAVQYLALINSKMWYRYTVYKKYVEPVLDRVDGVVERVDTDDIYSQIKSLIHDQQSP